MPLHRSRSRCSLWRLRRFRNPCRLSVRRRTVRHRRLRRLCAERSAHPQSQQKKCTLFHDLSIYRFVCPECAPPLSCGLGRRRALHPSPKQRLSDCRVRSTCRSTCRFGCWKVSVRFRCSPDRTREVVSLQRFGRCATRFVQPDDIRLYDFAAVDPSSNDRRQKVPTTRAAVLLGRSEGEAGTFSHDRSGLCRRLRFCMPRLLLVRSLRHVEMRRRLHRRSISGAHSSISRCTHSIPTLRSRSRPSSERYSSQ